jgi:hypothetical protein
MAVVDPNLEWLGYVQPVGLVLSPAILQCHGLVPEEQTRADGDGVAACLTQESDRGALRNSPLRRPRFCYGCEHMRTFGKRWNPFASMTAFRRQRRD